MSDIVERLLGHPGLSESVTVQFRTMVEQRHEAAAEIKRLTGQIGDILEHDGCACEALCLPDLRADNERLRRKLNEVDAHFTAEGHIHARECMTLRAEKDAEIERLRAAVGRLMDQPTMNPIDMTPDQRKELWAAHDQARDALKSTKP